MHPFKNKFQFIPKEISKEGFFYYKNVSKQGKRINLRTNDELYVRNQFEPQHKRYAVKYQLIVFILIVLAMIVCEYIIAFTEATPILFVFSLVSGSVLFYYFYHFTRLNMKLERYYKRLTQNLNETTSYDKFVVRCKEERMRPYYVPGKRKGKFNVYRNGWEYILFPPKVKLIAFIDLITLISVLIINTSIGMFLWDKSILSSMLANVLFVIVYSVIRKELCKRYTMKTSVSVLDNEFIVKVEEEEIKTNLKLVTKIIEEDTPTNGTVLMAILKDGSKQLLINLSVFDQFERVFFINGILRTNKQLNEVYLFEY